MDAMYWWLAAYLLGVAVRTSIMHGAVQNEKFRGDIDWQMVSILLWPVLLPFLLFRRAD